MCSSELSTSFLLRLTPKPKLLFSLDPESPVPAHIMSEASTALVMVSMEDEDDDDDDDE